MNRSIWGCGENRRVVKKCVRCYGGVVRVIRQKEAERKDEVGGHMRQAKICRDVTKKSDVEGS